MYPGIGSESLSVCAQVSVTAMTDGLFVDKLLFSVLPFAFVANTVNKPTVHVLWYLSKFHFTQRVGHSCGPWANLGNLLLI